MAAHVYAWPPVGTIGTEWTEVAPIGRSETEPNGPIYQSATERPKRAATLVVSALSAGKNGAGYCEVLKRYLSGGIHYVRLNSRPINWSARQRSNQNFANLCP